MEDKDFNKELEQSGVWQIASKIGIDVSAYKADSEDSLKNIQAEIKHAIQKRQYENTEAQNAADLKKLEDKPQLQEEYKEIKKEEKPNAEVDKEKDEKKAEEKQEEPVAMGDLLRRLSGRPLKSAASKSKTSEMPDPVKTTVNTLNTAATMLNKIYQARSQRRP